MDMYDSIIISYALIAVLCVLVLLREPYIK